MIYSSFHMTQDVAIAILPRIGRMSFLNLLNPLTGSKTKTKKNPLERMEGVALAAMLPPWSYKSELLTSKPKAYHHRHFEGHHPRQGDKQG